MNKGLKANIGFGVILIGLAVLFYCLHYFIFRDLHHIFFYLISDIAFLFIDVFIVMLVLEKILEYREREAILKKLNMVISTFFSEVGRDLLEKLIIIDSNVDKLRDKILINQDWKEKDFLVSRQTIKDHHVILENRNMDLFEMESFLINKRQFLLSLLENQNVLEHDEFTNLLWSVFHLADELSHRKDLNSLSDKDLAHIVLDLKRVYGYLILQWVDYMKHLKNDYPYLFSLAIRTNPFDKNARVEIN